MKDVRIIVLLIFLPLLVACQFQPDAEHVQRGDLLFVALPYDYHAANASQADSIRAALAPFHQEDCRLTDTLNIIHVAILDVVDDSLFVVDATLKRGVERYPWTDFLSDFTLHDGSLPTFFVGRLQDTSQTDRFVVNACRFIGQPYDVTFTPDNGAMYCSELVRESYVTAVGDTLFDQYPVDIRSPYGQVAPYWEWIFGIVGTSPLGIGVGTWPNTMISAPCIHLVDVQLPMVNQ